MSAITKEYIIVCNEQGWVGPESGWTSWKLNYNERDSNPLCPTLETSVQMAIQPGLPHLIYMSDVFQVFSCVYMIILEGDTETVMCNKYFCVTFSCKLLKKFS